ncbi:MAG: hypothetical protein ACREL3_09925 [Gemmatimonadales bacterium]
MRRLVLLALAGSLTLSACSNDNTTAPSAPGPEAAVVRCRPTPFPVLSLTTQIIKIFPVTGGLQAQALLKMVSIGALWTVCKPTDAQKGVVAFVNWMNQQFQAYKLIGKKTLDSSQRVSTLTNALYSAVGLGSPNVPSSAIATGNFGVGVYTGDELFLNTNSDSGGTRIPAGSFPNPTVITIFKRPDMPSPFPAGVVAPFYDVTASNASGTHTLSGNLTALVGFCVDDDVLGGFDSPAVAHLVSPGVFEVLQQASTDPLGLICDEEEGFSVKRLSLLDWGAAGRSIRAAAQALLLPEPALAAVATGKSGLGGLARSLSPFGVTEGDIAPLSCDEENSEANPEGIRSLNSDTPVDVTFVNHTDQSVSVYWLNFSGQREFPTSIGGGGLNFPYMVLEPNQSYVQSTFVTHPWILIGDDDTCYGIFLPRPYGGTVVVPYGPPVIIP